MLAKEPTFVPIVGARTRAQLLDTLGALHAKLSTSDVAAIDAAFAEGAIQGTRYGTEQMTHLDTEK